MKDLKFNTNKFIKPYGDDLLLRRAISLITGLSTYAERNNLLKEGDRLGEIFFSSNLSEYLTNSLEDGEKFAIRFSSDSKIDIDFKVLLISNGFEIYKNYEEEVEYLDDFVENDEVKIYG